MQLKREQIGVAPFTYIAEHEEAARLRSALPFSDAPLTKRWVDTENNIVLYELWSTGGPDWSSCEFVVFSQFGTIVFSMTWSGSPFNFHCEITKIEMPSSTPLNGIKSLITEALFCWASSMFVMEFSIDFTRAVLKKGAGAA